MKIINQVNDATWDELTLKVPYRSLFSTSFWIKNTALLFNLDYKLYYIKYKQSECLVPCFFSIHNPQTFRIGFIGYGGPLPIQGNVWETKNDIINILELELRLKCISLTHYPQKYLSYQPTNYTYLLELNQTYEKVFINCYTGNVRTAIRKSYKENLYTRTIKSNELDKSFLLIYETQRRVHSQYKISLELINFLFENPDYISIFGCFYEDKMLSTAVLLSSQQEAMHYLHGWDTNFKLKSSNQQLIDFMIQTSIARNCKFFNFGESHYQSLADSKKRWGATKYYVIRETY